MLLSEKDKLTIQNLHKSQPSAVGIVGEVGSGKLFFAKSLVKKILDTNKLVENARYIYLDALRHGGIDKIRQIQKDLAYSVPDTAKTKRVLLVKDFGRLSLEAQNSALKTLEEPPLSTIIILTINNKNQVLETVLSRLQIVNMHIVSEKECIDYYKNYPKNEIKKAYAISEGLPGLISGLLDGSESEIIHQIQRAKEITKMSRFDRLANINKLNKEERPDTILLVEAFVKLFKAIYDQSLQSGKIDRVISDKSKLEACIKAKEDLENGLSQKLALNRLFISI